MPIGIGSSSPDSQLYGSPLLFFVRSYRDHIHIAGLETSRKRSSRTFGPGEVVVGQFIKRLNCPFTLYLLVTKPRGENLTCSASFRHHHFLPLSISLSYTATGTLEKNWTYLFRLYNYSKLYIDLRLAYQASDTPQRNWTCFACSKLYHLPSTTLYQGTGTPEEVHLFVLTLKKKKNFISFTKLQER